MLKKFNPPSVPASPVLSQGVEASGIQRIVFVSGQVGVRSDGTVPDDIAEQTRLAIANLNAVLAEGGMTAEDIAKYTIYLTDAALIGPFMEAGGGTLPAPPPAATLLIVKALAAPNLLVEIEAIAVK